MNHETDEHGIWDHADRRIPLYPIIGGIAAVILWALFDIPY